MIVSRRAPSYSLIDPAQPSNEGRRALRGVLITGIYEDASRIMLQPHEKYPSFIHAVMHFVREKPLHTMSPGWDALLAHLKGLPDNHLRLNLDQLVDEKLSEFRPINSLAHDQIAGYRAALRKDYEAFIDLDEEKGEAEIRLVLIKSKGHA